MVSTMDGDLPNRCLFLFVIFLFGLPLALGKLQALVLGDITLDACYEVWSNVICSFMLLKKNV